MPPTDAPTTVDPVELQHLTLLCAARERTRRDVLRLRAGAVAAVAAFITVHGFAQTPRYMSLAPLMAAAAWAHEASLSHRLVALGWLERAVRGEVGPKPPRMSLDLGPFAAQSSWRRAVLGPARAAMYVPLCVVTAVVAIDAQGLRSSDVPGELAWYLVVGFMTFAAMVLVAWSWWVDFLAERPTVSTVASVAAPVVVTPAPLPDGSGAIPGPFPVRRIESARSDGAVGEGARGEGVRSESTQTFGTPL